MNNKTDHIFAVCLTLLLTIIGVLTVVFVIAMCNAVRRVESVQSNVDTVYVVVKDTLHYEH